MLVSDTHKFVFHHVPNTAGSSITAVLGKYCRGYRGQPVEVGGSPTPDGCVWPMDVHCGYEMHTPVKNVDYPKDYFSFAFTRKPEDMDYLVDDRGKCLVDFVGRYEYLNEDFKTILNWLEIPDEDLPRYNVSGNIEDEFSSKELAIKGSQRVHHHYFNMKITPVKEKDFGYVVIENLFSKDELESIWKEIFYLDHVMDLSKVKRIRSSNSRHDSDGKSVFTGDGVVVDSVYTDREYSPILTFNRRLWFDEVVNAMSESHPANETYGMCSADQTFLNRYKNYQGYGKHKDNASFTSITTLLHNPEQIDGGRFKFVDYNITFERANNVCIIFPSWVMHEAEEIKSLNLETGVRRYSVSMFSYNGPT